MARYYDVEADLRFIALDLSEQLRPGTFEHSLSYLIDHELDLSHFDLRYCNDDTGAPAYPPAMLLKVVLFGYSQGLVSSRSIARACARDATFIALSGDSQPHFTTIAHFVSSLGDDIVSFPE
jgi:transposase